MALDLTGPNRAMHPRCAMRNYRDVRRDSNHTHRFTETPHRIALLRHILNSASYHAPMLDAVNHYRSRKRTRSIDALRCAMSCCNVNRPIFFVRSIKCDGKRIKLILADEFLAIHQSAVLVASERRCARSGHSGLSLSLQNPTDHKCIPLQMGLTPAIF